ncbi:hypothetical protein [Algoriphagus hitonicola]|uniref:Lipoprotein n=1 Tax=Algoriphagus hitonicola TaxID=435880 RepID=A0A1I2NT91_9BACT|nr:hypothetical protein [Algoriphagus hitonicola]SFG07185.1 hypothetical protein SAMN04487988_101303 [Algoriphagus hitonicola]
MRQLLLIGIFALSGCASNLVQAPKGSVPNRSNLDRDGYGGYVTLVADGNYILGELIGNRNDTVMVLGEHGLTRVPMDQITFGQLIAHDPNDYLGVGLLSVIPNALMMTVGGYGGGPIAYGLVFSVINLFGMSTAMGTEDLKFNDFDWSKEKDELLKYSRFPGGIPEPVDLDKLSTRPMPPAKSKDKKRKDKKAI